MNRTSAEDKHMQIIVKKPEGHIRLERFIMYTYVFITEAHKKITVITDNIYDATEKAWEELPDNSDWEKGYKVYYAGEN